MVGTHQIIAQLFQAFFFAGPAEIPELVRMGKLDSVLVLPIDSQFAVSDQTIQASTALSTLVLGGAVVCVSLSKLEHR